MPGLGGGADLSSANRRAAAARHANPTRFPFDFAIFDTDGVCVARFLLPTPGYRYFQTCPFGFTLEGVPGRILLDSVPSNADETGPPRLGMETPSAWRNAPTLLPVDAAFRVLDQHRDTEHANFFATGEYPELPGYAISTPGRRGSQVIAWTHDQEQARIIAHQCGEIVHTEVGEEILDRLGEGLSTQDREKARLDTLVERMRELRLADQRTHQFEPANVERLDQERLPCSGHPRWRGVR